MPSFQVLIFATCLGRYPVGLKLGIVNYEVENQSECRQWLQQNASYGMDDDCVYMKTSCHFLNEIHVEDAIKVYYKSFEVAYADAKKGKLSGIIVMASNFSESKLAKSLSMFEFDNSLSNDQSGQIQIYMDQSELQTTTFLEYRLLKAYERFNKKLLNGCNLNEKIEEVPMNFRETINGDLMNDFRRTMAPILFIQLS